MKGIWDDRKVGGADCRVMGGKVLKPTFIHIRPAREVFAPKAVFCSTDQLVKSDHLVACVRIEDSSPSALADEN
jgi:hypothetical protein